MTTLTSASATAATTQVFDELAVWLEENWDPDLTVGEWWERLGGAGWAAPGLPVGSYGRGLGRNDAVRVQNQIAEFGALGAPAGLGLLLAAPTIASHGTRAQIEHYVRDIVTGVSAWCQLFSEPGAGSDLAGLRCKAVADGDEWIINGQKVWTSLGHIADLGMLIARTNVEVPKHAGITWFAFDMHQPGVDVRPLREMTGHAMFNEVFLTDARVANDAIIGDRDGGWAVTNTTLMNERSGLGSGGGGVGGSAMPGTVSGQLSRRAGDFVTARPGRGGAKKKKSGAAAPTSGASGAAASPFGASTQLLVNLAQGNGVSGDASVRQDLVRLHTLSELGRFNNLRMKATKAAGGDIPGMANISKLAMSEMVRLSRDVGLRILGAHGMLHPYENSDRVVLEKATGNPFLPMVTTMALFAQAPSIYGGTDQIQRNIIGERVLGLPKEPSNDRTAAFSELPANT